MLSLLLLLWDAPINYNRFAPTGCVWLKAMIDVTGHYPIAIVITMIINIPVHQDLA